MPPYPNPIRFGIMCDGHSLGAWERRTVDLLLEIPNISLELLIIDAPKTKPSSFSDKLRRVPLKRLLWTSYSRLLYKPAATRRVGIADLVSRVPTIECTVRLQGKFSQYFEDADINAIAEYKLDFVLRFAFNIIRGKILDTPRYGVWSFHHDDETKYRGAPPCFWEIYHRDPVTGAILQRLTNRLDGGVVLKKGFFRTKFYSYEGTIDMVYGESAHWPAAICRQLQLDAQQIDFITPTLTQAPIYYPPTNGQLLTFGLKMLASKVRKAFEVLFQTEAWNIGVVEQPIQAFLEPQQLAGTFISTAPLSDPNLFYADCFGREEGGQTQIYFELYDYRTGRGNISRLSYPWQVSEKPHTILDLPFHLSYPYLFGPYCIPESAAEQRVARYDLPHAGPMPGTAHTLLPNTRGIDSTLLEHGGTFWLFYTRIDRDPDLNLYIAYASHLDGPWQEHPLNPVKTDVRSARPAGTPFLHEGRLYRPAQDFSRGYGYGITINEITELTTTTFAERSASALTSLHPSYPDGMHTVSAVGPNRTVIDFKRHTFGLANLVRRFK